MWMALEAHNGKSLGGIQLLVYLWVTFLVVYKNININVYYVFPYLRCLKEN